MSQPSSQINDLYYYDYYDYEVQSEEFTEICHEFEYSILFFLVSCVVGITFLIYGIVLYTKRRNLLLNGLDILFSLVLLCAAIR